MKIVYTLILIACIIFLSIPGFSLTFDIYSEKTVSHKSDFNELAKKYNFKITFPDDFDTGCKVYKGCYISVAYDDETVQVLRDPFNCNYISDSEINAILDKIDSKDPEEFLKETMKRIAQKETENKSIDLSRIFAGLFGMAQDD
ncbi:MAG: hypothetical protein HY831_01965 [Candidatus Aenigmarchaeota archaeon]|nr:hypothetical protein [Candidatus Aenigmarchaeota archaeon]